MLDWFRHLLEPEQDSEQVSDSVYFLNGSALNIWVSVASDRLC